ncbi:MAG: M23 family metallopeptidase [Sphingomonadales bacterium]|jgi:murein DD-endopeptidase MepM/ murein hydrolase activator NlpD
MLRIFLLFLVLIVTSPAHALELSGMLKQGGLLIGKVSPGAKVWLDDKPLDVTADGRFIFGFPREAASSAVLRFTNGAGEVEERTLEIAPQNYKIDRIDGLPPRTVTIPEEEKKRRAKERSMVVNARADQSRDLYWANGFRLPVEGARISGVYGSQRILNGKPSWPHYGLDMAAPVGTAVKAPAAGVVKLAQSDFLLEGGIIIIDHGFGVSSTLMHLNSVDVEVGQFVTPDDVVATLGSSGRATGPHLDWRINWKDVRVDPALALEIKPIVSE